MVLNMSFWAVGVESCCKWIQNGSFANAFVDLADFERPSLCNSAVGNGSPPHEKGGTVPSVGLIER